MVLNNEGLITKVIEIMKTLLYILAESEESYRHFDSPETFWKTVC